MAASPEPWPDSALFAVSGIAGKVSENSRRETYPGRLASCVPMGSRATPMEFLRPTTVFGRQGPEVRISSPRPVILHNINQLLPFRQLTCSDEIPSAGILPDSANQQIAGTKDHHFLLPMCSIMLSA